MDQFVGAVLLAFLGALAAFMWGGQRQRRRERQARERAQERTNERIDNRPPTGGLDGPSVTQRLRQLLRRNRR